MKKRIVILAAAISVIGAGAAFASMTYPNTTEYILKTTPMITGTITSMDERRIVVNTEEGEAVTLMIDSRTMLPVDMTVGTSLRAEFKMMESGQYYATRITPIRGLQNVDATQTSWRDTETRTTAANERAEYENASTPSTSPDNVLADATAVDEGLPANRESDGRDDDESLPQTAGTQPLILLFGLGALAVSVALMMNRRTGA